jgi:hypothetical protein
MLAIAEEFSVRRFRLLTVFALFVVAAGIAMANISTGLLTLEDLTAMMYEQKTPERGYGWPLTWYWWNCTALQEEVRSGEYARPHAGFWRHLAAPRTEEPCLSRCNRFAFAANLLVWVVMLGAVWAFLIPLLRRYRFRPARSPRRTTAFLLAIASTLTALANLSCDASPDWDVPTYRQFSYGWPFTCYRYLDMANKDTMLRAWDYSLTSLVGNAVVWLLISAVALVAWERLVHRYQPRLRRTLGGSMGLHFQFSLRFLLLATAIVAIVLGIFANRFQQRLRFIAAMNALHVEVFHEDADDACTQWLARWLGDDLVLPVWGVNVWGIGDDDLSAFEYVPDLRQLAVFNSTITREGVLRISRLKKLESLALDSDRFSMRDLEPLACLPRLKNLEVPADGEPLLLVPGDADAFLEARGDGAAASVKWLTELLPRCQIYFDPEFGAASDEAGDD